MLNGNDNITADDVISIETFFARFDEIAKENGTTGMQVLLDFMRDYIVSSGHPEKVNNKYPWNNKQ